MEIGVDIVEIERIKKIYERNNKFLYSFFSEYEINKFNILKNKFQFLAGRFAAKEAYRKVYNIHENLKNIDVRNDENGKPFYYINNKKIEFIKLSISHEINYAIAFAINEKS